MKDKGLDSINDKERIKELGEKKILKFNTFDRILRDQIAQSLESVWWKKETDISLGVMECIKQNWNAENHSVKWEHDEKVEGVIGYPGYPTVLCGWIFRTAANYQSI